jgi:hypothetical protein
MLMRRYSQSRVSTGTETRRPTGRPSHLTPETFSMPAALRATSLSRQWTRPLTGSHVALCRACEPPVARSACARNRESVFDNEYGFRGLGWRWVVDLALGVERHWCFNTRYPCSAGLAQLPTLQSSPSPEDALFTVLGCILEGSRSPLAAIPTPARTMDRGMADMGRREGAGPRRPPLDQQKQRKGGERCCATVALRAVGPTGSRTVSYTKASVGLHKRCAAVRLPSVLGRSCLCGLPYALGLRISCEVLSYGTLVYLRGQEACLICRWIVGRSKDHRRRHVARLSPASPLPFALLQTQNSIPNPNQHHRAFITLVSHCHGHFA